MTFDANRLEGYEDGPTIDNFREWQEFLKECVHGSFSDAGSLGSRPMAPVEGSLIQQSFLDTSGLALLELMNSRRTAVASADFPLPTHFNSQQTPYEFGAARGKEASPLLISLDTMNDESMHLREQDEPKNYQAFRHNGMKGKRKKPYNKRL